MKKLNGTCGFIAFDKRGVLLQTNTCVQTNKKESIENEQQNDEQKLASQEKLLQKKPSQEQLYKLFTTGAKVKSQL